MIKFAVVKFFRQQPCRKVVLSEEEAWLLGFKEKDGIIQIPSDGTLLHFVKYRLGVEGVDKKTVFGVVNSIKFLYQI